MRNKEKSIYYRVKEFWDKIPPDMRFEDPANSDKYGLLKELHENAPGLVYIFNNATLGYDYFSENVKSILGFDASDFVNGGLKFAMGLVHPEHNKIYNEYIIPQMFKYIHLFTERKRAQDLRFCYTFKIQRSNGDYMWAMHTMNPIELTPQGMPAKFLVFVTDVTPFKSDDHVGFTVSEKEENKFYRPIYSCLYPVTDEIMDFSERELTILQQLCSGKTSIDIAKELGISHHTVNTHRKKMLEKTGSNNTAEMLQKSYIKGILQIN